MCAKSCKIIVSFDESTECYVGGSPRLLFCQRWFHKPDPSLHSVYGSSICLSNTPEGAAGLQDYVIGTGLVGQAALSIMFTIKS